MGFASFVQLLAHALISFYYIPEQNSLCVCTFFCSYEKAKVDFGTALQVLEDHLSTSKTAYLVNDDQVTLADIVVVSTLVYPFKLTCDQMYLKPYPAVQRWFKACVDQPEFKEVLGVTTMCKKELKPKGQ